MGVVDASDPLWQRFVVAAFTTLAAAIALAAVYKLVEPRWPGRR